MDGGVSGEELFRLVRQRELELPAGKRAAFRAGVARRVEELLSTPPAEKILAQAIRDAVAEVGPG